MKHIPLTQGYEAIVDDEDYPFLSRFKWSVRLEGSRRDRPYAWGYIDGHKVSMHRLILNARKGAVSDHINHDSLDNRKENLRTCTHKENLANSRKPQGHETASPYKGLHKLGKGLFAASRGGMYLGSFSSEKAAAMAYDKSLRDAYPLFANTNFSEAKYDEDFVERHRRDNRARKRLPRSGFKGVFLHKPTGRWNTRIPIKRKIHSVGYHKTAESAARVYDYAARAVWGEDCYLNFSDVDPDVSEKTIARTKKILDTKGDKKS